MPAFHPINVTKSQWTDTGVSTWKGLPEFKPPPPKSHPGNVYTDGAQLGSERPSTTGHGVCWGDLTSGGKSPGRKMRGALSTRWHQTKWTMHSSLVLCQPNANEIIWKYHSPWTGKKQEQNGRKLRKLLFKAKTLVATHQTHGHRKTSEYVSCTHCDSEKDPQGPISSNFFQHW